MYSDFLTIYNKNKNFKILYRRNKNQYYASFQTRNNLSEIFLNLKLMNIFYS